MRRVAVLVALVAAIVVLPALAAGRVVWLRVASWADNNHGWVVCRESVVCASDDGGRTWHDIFTGGNFVFARVRTSATAGVVSTGRTVAATFWTRNGGARWYELPDVPVPEFTNPPESEAGRPLVLGGRGESLFWHRADRTLRRLTPWPPPADPPCRAESWPGKGTCVLSEADSPFTSTAVATIPDGELFGLWPIPRGVIALVLANRTTSGSTRRPPIAVLVQQAAASDVRQLPAPPVDASSLTAAGVAAAWPQVFVEAVVAQDGKKFSQLPRVLWQSFDGGASWRVGHTTQVARRNAATTPGRLGTQTAVPGGWVAPFRTAPPRLAFNRFGRRFNVKLPSGASCRSAARLTAAWPALFVTAGGARWWSSDAGTTWAVFGTCGSRS
jgi:hypothetical protein